MLIRWRVADAIPLVACATFPDCFLTIICTTLVMVLVSGILIMKFTGIKETAKVECIHRWSIRSIPPVPVLRYVVLFIAFLQERG